MSITATATTATGHDKDTPQVDNLDLHLPRGEVVACREIELGRQDIVEDARGGHKHPGYYRDE